MSHFKIEAEIEDESKVPTNEGQANYDTYSYIRKVQIVCVKNGCKAITDNLKLPPENQEIGESYTPILEEKIKDKSIYKEVINDLLPEHASDIYKSALVERLFQEIEIVRTQIADKQGLSVEKVYLAVNSVKAITLLLHNYFLQQEPKLNLIENLPGKIYGMPEHDLNAKWQIFEFDPLSRICLDEMVHNLPDSWVFNKNEALKKEWNLCLIATEDGSDQIFVYYPKETFKDKKTLTQSMSKIASADFEMQKLLDLQKQTVQYVVFPSRDFVPRSAYIPKAKAVITSSQEQELYGSVLPHEAVHALLGNVYGNCYVPMLEEGIAVYLSSIKFPEYHQNARKDYYDAIDIGRFAFKKNDKIPLDHTQVFSNNSEAKYPYGYLFVRYYIEKYGLEMFLKLYETTSQIQKYLTDKNTGKTLIQDGNKLGTEQEILEAGILASHPDITIEQIKKEFAGFCRKAVFKNLFSKEELN